MPSRWTIPVGFAVLVLLTLVALVACSQSEPVVARGTAQSRAATEEARTEVLTQAADQASVDAAGKRATADALAQQEQQQRRLAEQAEQRGDLGAAKAAWQQAAELRKSASTADLEAAQAQAIAQVTRTLARDAAVATAQARTQAQAERESEAAAAELRHWIQLCRWIGLAGVVGGVLIGGVLAYVVGPHVGVPIGGLLAATGLLAVAFGQTVTWLPLAVGLAGVVACGVWVRAHHATLQVGAALSHTVDALEGKTVATVSEAKDALHVAVEQAGLRHRFDRLRDRWQKTLPSLRPKSRSA